MILAIRYCTILTAIAALVSLVSMATIIVFDMFSPSGGTEQDWISQMGDWTVCVLWIGGSMGSLAWARVRVGNPSFNSGACRESLLL